MEFGLQKVLENLYANIPSTQNHGTGKKSICMDWNWKQVDQTQDEPNQSIYAQSERKNFVWIPRIASLFVAFTLSKYWRPPSDIDKIVSRCFRNIIQTRFGSITQHKRHLIFRQIFQQFSSHQNQDFESSATTKNLQKIFSKRKSIFQREISRNLFCDQNS